MEKPFCRTPAEADEIVAASTKRNVKLALAMRNRYHPALPVVDRLVKEGAIGKLLELRARGKEDMRGGALDLWVLGPHLLNLIHYFAGNPLSCSAIMLQDGRAVTRTDIKAGDEGVGPIAGNALHARFEMERGAPAYFDSIQKAGIPHNTFGLRLIGTRGIISFSIDNQTLAHLLPGSPFQPDKAARNWIPITSEGLGKSEPIEDLSHRVSDHVLAARDLIASIKEDRAPLCSANDGRVTVEMTAAVFESHRLNGERVTLPLAMRDNPLTRL